MVTFLFWNLSKKSGILPHLSCLVQTHDVDIFILAECPKDLNPAIGGLNALNVGRYREEVASTGKVRALTRLGTRVFIHRFTGSGKELAIWSLQTSKLSQAEILVAGVHLLSKAGGNQDVDQASVARDIIDELYDIEDKHNHQNTVLVGDFNMHPYDPGMTSVTGVHGLMTKELAQRPDRIHRHKPWRRFYNPMWGLFGDRTPGPAGSYYWQASVLHNPYWQILDQVLVRPALINYLKDLHILDNDGNHTLMRPSGVPDSKHFSDHLPVLFRLDV